MPDLNAFNLLDEPVADRLQSFKGPRMEPVNGGALDKSRESTGPKTKGTAHGRQTQYHLQKGKQGHKESLKHTYTNRSLQTCIPILEHDIQPSAHRKINTGHRYHRCIHKGNP